MLLQPVPRVQTTHPSVQRSQDRIEQRSRHISRVQDLLDLGFGDRPYTGVDLSDRDPRERRPLPVRPSYCLGEIANAALTILEARRDELANAIQRLETPAGVNQALGHRSHWESVANEWLRHVTASFDDREMVACAAASVWDEYMRDVTDPSPADLDAMQSESRLAGDRRIVPCVLKCTE